MPVLWAYARDLFQTPGFGDTIDFVQTKQHYYLVHTNLNPSGIVPDGPGLSVWLAPHGRDALPGRPFRDGTPPAPPPRAPPPAPPPPPPPPPPPSGFPPLAPLTSPATIPDRPISA